MFFPSELDEVFELWQPTHVETLVLVKGHAFDKSAKMFVHAEALEIFCKTGLNTFVKSSEVRSSVYSHLSFKTVEGAMSRDVFTDHDWIEIHFSVHAGSLHNHTFFSWSVSDDNSEITVVLAHALFFFGGLFLPFFFTVLRSWLSGFEVDFNLLVTNSFAQNHADFAISLCKLESTFV